jgi:multiple sugar transport system substrate-binding protein
MIAKRKLNGWLGTRRPSVLLGAREPPVVDGLGARRASSPAIRYFLFLVLVWAGCKGQSPTPPKEPSSPEAHSGTSVALHVLVVNDQPLAEAIERLRGEWREESGGELTATSKPWSEVATADTIDADVLIFPTRYMGELCVRGELRPVRKSVLEDKTLDMGDVFPLVRRQLIAWGGETMALPLGIDFAGASPNWNPVGAVAFLVRVAPSVVQPNRAGDLFDPETMKSRISDPALIASVQGISQPPDDQRIPARVPLLGIGDRLAGVTTSSRNAASAFKLLAWLASRDVSSQLARVGDGMLPVRKSLVSSPAWYDSRLTASERADVGKNLEASLGGNECLIVPRIPGVDEYLVALDDAVKQIASAKVKPDEAFRHAAEKWEQITDAHGREAQRQAYLKHLGISE